MPSANSVMRPLPARSFRPRRRNRMTACAKRSVPSAQSATTITSEPQVARDHHPLHLVRPLADLEDLLVAEETGDGELLHEAVAAVDLERCVDDAVAQEAGVELRLRSGESKGLALILQPRGAVDELPARLDLGRHVGELELHG